ncbi:MAG: nitroreductase family deazaflavin-dependent oxidoreductase [Actinomycetota bacterium]
MGRRRAPRRRRRGLGLQQQRPSRPLTTPGGGVARSSTPPPGGPPAHGRWQTRRRTRRPARTGAEGLEEPIVQLPESLESHEYAYLTTTGRRTGRPHRVEIWFAVVDGTVWVGSGGGTASDWVANLLAEPQLSLEVGTHRWSATADVHRGLGDHPARARLLDRYGDATAEELSDWARDCLLVEIRPDRGSTGRRPSSRSSGRG